MKWYVRRWQSRRWRLPWIEVKRARPVLYVYLFAGPATILFVRGFKV